jgi:ribonuclease-3
MDDSKIRQFMVQHGIDIPIELMKEAVTHPSSRWGDVQIRSYERLETLGDSVLDLIVLQLLMVEDKRAESGELTHKRSILVNNEVLGIVGENLGLLDILQTAEGYTIVKKDLANALEAIFGAVFQASGFQSCQTLLAKIWEEMLNAAKFYETGTNNYNNPIGYLQELIQKRGEQLPVYITLEKVGPDHDPDFTIECSVILDNHMHQVTGTGKSIQKGKVQAARHMIDLLKKEGFT